VEPEHSLIVETDKQTDRRTDLLVGDKLGINGLQVARVWLKPWDLLENQRREVFERQRPQRRVVFAAEVLRSASAVPPILGTRCSAALHQAICDPADVEGQR
jgi:hypothetical protein